MKELELVIKKKAFTYKQVYKSDVGYVYEQFLDDKSIGFETFFRKENTQFNCISFPGDEAFGTWAWSVKSIERAIDKLTTF
jgi:hypothetical protein